VLLARVGERNRIEIDAPGEILGMARNPATGEQRRAAEVLAQQARLAAGALAEQAAGEREVVGRVLHGALVEREAVGAARLRRPRPEASTCHGPPGRAQLGAAAGFQQIEASRARLGVEAARPTQACCRRAARVSRTRCRRAAERLALVRFPLSALLRAPIVRCNRFGRLPFSRRSDLRLAPGQLEILRRHSTEGLRRAAETLRGREAAAGGSVRSLGLAVLELRSLSLAEFPDAAPLPDGEDHAVVALALGGGLPGTALLALAPGDALRWIRSAGAAEAPLRAFVGLATCVLGEWCAGLARAFGVDARAGASALREDSVVAVALGTHPPPDTALVCARVSLSLGEDDVATERALPAFLYLLVETKVLAALLPGLESR
jgi:hypothetical protein